MEDALRHIKALDGFDRDEVQRFLEKVRIDPTTGCWMWVAYRNPGGYGKFTIPTGRLGGNSLPAHRRSHEFFIGPIPAGFQVHHKCNNHACVNPAHLEALGVADHVARTAGHPKNKTHCLRGHEFTPENTRLYKGARQCRACVRLRMHWRRDPDYQEKPAVTNLYCKNGHPLFGANLHLVERDGKYVRYCRACRNEATARYNTENAQAVLAAKTLRRADRIAARKLKNRAAIISLRQTAHLLPASTLISTLRRLLNDCD